MGPLRNTREQKIGYPCSESSERNKTTADMIWNGSYMLGEMRSTKGSTLVGRWFDDHGPRLLVKPEDAVVYQNFLQRA